MGGFGTGIILTAALAPFIGVKAVIPVLAVAGAIINAGRFWFYRESLQRQTLTLVVACALPFLVLGTWIYSVLDARAVGTVLGIVVILSVPLRRALSRRKIALGRAGLGVGSGVFGLASGLTSGVGVILVSLLLGTGLSGQAVLATAMCGAQALACATGRCSMPPRRSASSAATAFGSSATASAAKCSGYCQPPSAPRLRWWSARRAATGATGRSPGACGCGRSFT